MPNFVYAYHGGKPPESPEEGAKVMAAWNAWFEALGAAVVDGGAPVGASKTVSSGGVSDGGGANPLSGYSIVSADNIDAAVEMAKGCPILEGGGSIEVAEAMEM
ncbi:YciI family protein [Nitratireductor sp. XY-223]|uniref:YciI family protein n=1 Tax=Nitratireductor sp. XY-223 TaxID=2561926 RepID=UPI0010AAC556|nr:YciI family protein [Nitratireductor sp. XY-223]